MTTHLVVAPLVLPVIAAGFMLLLDERRRNWKATLGFVSIGLQALVALALLAASTERVKNGGEPIFHSHMWDGSTVTIEDKPAPAAQPQ